MKKLFVSISVVLTITAGIAQAAGDVAAGKEKASMCLACHGADGNSTNPAWPKLAGQGEAYLVKQLQDFKSGARKDPTMQGMVAALTPEDMANLAAFYAGQTSSKGATDEDYVEVGRQIWRAGIPATNVAACASCHGATGAGIPAAKFPRISFQHADYTIKQLKDFRNGSRNNDAGQMMQGVTHRMTDDEITAVANYAQGLY